VLPPAVNSTLSLVAPRAGGRVVVSPVRRDGSIGEPEDVDLAAGTSSTVRLAPDAVAVQFTGVSGGPVGANLVSWVSDPRGSLISVLAVDLPPPLIPPTSAVHDRTLG